MVRAEQGTVFVEGAMNMDNARALRDAARAHFQAPLTKVDLSGAKEIDSAAVALLLEWRRDALQSGIELRFVNAPASITSLGTLYGVTALLGLA